MRGSIIVLMLCAFVLGVATAPAARSAPKKHPQDRKAAMSRSATQAGKGNADRQKGEIPTTAGVMYGPTRSGTAVYPGQDIPIKFNHGVHLAKGMDCSTCHEKIGSSRRARDNNFPRGESCDSCHTDQHNRTAEAAAAVPPKCGMCHVDVDDKNRVTSSLRAPPPLLHFNHQLHAQKGASCESCHGDMSKVRLASTLQLPREADCLSCHDGFGATSRCGACHPAQRDGRLVTRAIDDRAMPQLVPRGASSWGAEHDLTFVEDHAHISKANPKLCESCHSETFCTDCHAGVIRPMRIHSGDYLNVHAMDARARTQDCQSCHRTQTFCLGCHQRLGLESTSSGGFNVGGGLTFHPAGWSGPPGAPQDHAHAAQRNIAACSSCHTEDSCLACHATTGASTPGLGVNPHGRGFRDSAKCNALATRNRRVCLKCHVPGSMALECL
jgi:hypothetical protein